MDAASRHAGDKGIELREAVRRVVLEAGFDRVGFAAAGPARSAKSLRRWIERGFAGTMAYMERSPERRSDPTRLLEGARTVIAVALHYRGPGDRKSPEPSGRAEIASYARGTDYHRVMEARLRGASLALENTFPARYRYYVDTGPVLERDWAEQAGIGW